MSKPYLMHFYSIASLLFFRSILCSKISSCDQDRFVGSCNSITGPLKSQNTFEPRAKATWKDCLKLYEDAIDHLNISTLHTNPNDVKKWLNVALVNHQECQNGFKDSSLSLHLKNLTFMMQNFFKSLTDVLAKNKPSSSNLSTTHGHRLVQLAEGATTRPDLVVAQDGSGDFLTVNEAITASVQRRVGIERFVIYVKSGVYKENVIIESSMINLMLTGDGIDATIITSDKNVNDGYQTSNTATFQIWGSGFVAAGITFENSAGPEKGQAVALLSSSDLSAFYKCSFKSYQDTLCLLHNRQFYRECDIYGTVDFIFGDAAALLQNCSIYVRKPKQGQENTITAQGRTDPSSETGFVIHNSRVVADPDLALADWPVRSFLGRPWRNYARVVFVKCFLDSLIDPQGWMPFREGSGLDTVYYAEFMNTGLGADVSRRVTWPGYHVLTAGEEVDQFSGGRFLSGDSWIPQIGVPFDHSI